MTESTRPLKWRLSKPFTATAAIQARMRQIGITRADLASEADVPETTLRYFGLLSHDPRTLERLSVALGWPHDHIARQWVITECGREALIRD